MSEIANVSKGEVAAKVKVEEGKLKLELAYDGKGLDSSVVVAVELGYVLDKIAEKIPGTMDDSLVALIKAALKA